MSGSLPSATQLEHEAKAPGAPNKLRAKPHGRDGG